MLRGQLRPVRIYRLRLHPGNCGRFGVLLQHHRGGFTQLDSPVGWLVLADAALLFLLAWACRSSTVRGGFTQGSPVDAPSLLLTVPLLFVVVDGFAVILSVRHRIFFFLARECSRTLECPLPLPVSLIIFWQE